MRKVLSTLCDSAHNFWIQERGCVAHIRQVVGTDVAQEAPHDFAVARLGQGVRPYSMTGFSQI